MNWGVVTPRDLGHAAVCEGAHLVLQLGEGADVVEPKAVLKSSLAQGYAGNLGRMAKQKRARPTADRGQRSLLLPIAGGRRKKEEAATEPALAATSRKRPERCQTTLLRNGSRWVLLSARRLWRRTMHYGVALGPA